MKVLDYPIMNLIELGLCDNFDFHGNAPDSLLSKNVEIFIFQEKKSSKPPVKTPQRPRPNGTGPAGGREAEGWKNVHKKHITKTN